MAKSRTREQARSLALDRAEPITETGCFIYLGSVTLLGYGRHINFGKERETPHRLVARAGPGDFVCHTCDEPSCVNPAHLYIGTPASNMEDKVRRGRQYRPPKKLSDEQVAEILAAKESSLALADKYGVTSRTIRRLRHRAGQRRPSGLHPIVE